MEKKREDIKLTSLEGAQRSTVLQYPSHGCSDHVKMYIQIVDEMSLHQSLPSNELSHRRKDGVEARIISAIRTATWRPQPTTVGILHFTFF